MQTPEAIKRVAAECAEDLAADGVVYAEVRDGNRAVDAGWTRARRGDNGMVRRLRRGAADARARRQPDRDPRDRDGDAAVRRSAEVAELCDQVTRRRCGRVRHRGPGGGLPPTRYLDAFELIHRANFHMTIHAGEAFGLPSIWEALQCGRRAARPWRAHRRRHHSPRTDGRARSPAAYVRDRRVPLEMCPTSNVHTGAVESIAKHPIDLLRRLRFRVTVNTDNRLMSGVSMSSEFAALTRPSGSGSTRWSG